MAPSSRKNDPAALRGRDVDSSPPHRLPRPLALAFDLVAGRAGSRRGFEPASRFAPALGLGLGPGGGPALRGGLVGEAGRDGGDYITPPETETPATEMGHDRGPGEQRRAMGLLDDAELERS